MATILNLLVERLDIKISKLKKARKKLQDKNLEDVKLEHKIHGLESIRDKLKKQNPTGGQGINPTHTSGT